MAQGYCCGGSPKTKQKVRIHYSDGTTEERDSMAAARIRAARDPKARLEPVKE